MGAGKSDKLAVVPTGRQKKDLGIQQADANDCVDDESTIEVVASVDVLVDFMMFFALFLRSIELNLPYVSQPTYIRVLTLK